MKLATINDGSRDGQLIVVSRDLTRAIKVSDIAETMQAALDQWIVIEPKLDAVYQQLNNDENLADSVPFDANGVESPLPRAYQWADGSAYVNHVELVRKARGATMPENFWTDPLMYQGGSDGFLAPCANIVAGSTEWGIDFEGEIGVVLTDVPYGISAAQAEKTIALVMLINDVSLRNLIPNELGKGFGFFQSKPASAFSPVAVTIDELGTAWHEGKVHLPLVSHMNGKLFGQPNAGVDMTFNFPQLIAHAAKTRTLAAGAIIGSGTVSNVDRSAGGSCIAEKRMLEIIDAGEAKTPYMQYGDRIRIEMFDDDNNSIFGAIDQQVAPIA